MKRRKPREPGCAPRERTVRPHTCSVCGAERAWDNDWWWYGSMRDIDDGLPVLKICSSACMDQVKADPEAKYHEFQQKVLGYVPRRKWERRKRPAVSQ